MGFNVGLSLKATAKYLFFISALCLSACIGPPTIKELKADPAGIVEFRVEQPYQVVYRRILDLSRKCFEFSALGGASGHIQSDLFVTEKRGEISGIVMSLKREIAIHTAVVSYGENSTKISVYYSMSGIKWRADAVKEWVINNSNECDP